MKKIKARIIDEDGKLAFALIEVPEGDSRPAFNPATESLKVRDVAMDGKGPESL